MLEILFYSLLPLAALALGAVVAILRPPSRQTTAKIQHLAAGVIFCAVAVELLPPVHAQSPAETIAGFAAGIATVLAIRAVSRRIQRGGKWGSAGLLITTAVDVAIDGLVIGAAFASGGSRGLLMLAAISLEFLFLGMASAVSVQRQSRSAIKILGLILAMGGLAVGGTMGGAALLSGVSPKTMAAVLAFGAVAMMYLVTEELLVEAHEVREGTWDTASFFIGFLIYLPISEGLSEQ